MEDLCATHLGIGVTVHVAQLVEKCISSAKIWHLTQMLKLSVALDSICQMQKMVLM